jgi:TRIAD3 protein (E3 ubiquitin-protein ligase RNF216)
VCSKNVTNYEHFGQVAQGRCPLHENVEERHEQEVKKAADEAMAKVRADHPDLSEVDLMVKVSDRVKKAEDARKGQAQVRVEAFPYHMVENELQHRPFAEVNLDLGLHRPAQAIQPAQGIQPAPQYVPYPYAVAPVPLFDEFPVQPLPLVQQFPPQFYNPFGPVAQQYVGFHRFQPFQPFPFPFPDNNYYHGHPPNQYR